MTQPSASGESQTHSFTNNQIMMVQKERNPTRKYIKQDQTLLWTCVVSAHLQWVNNHYAKFEYKGMKSV